MVQNAFSTDGFSGKKIYLVAPASGVSPSRMQALEQKLADLNISVSEQLLTSDCMFHSSNDTSRLQQLISALYDEADGVIWCLRGGYGSARLLEHLRFLPKPNKEKIFIGCSDITALHLFLSNFWQWHTIHGAGLAQLIESEPRDTANFTRIAELITGKLSQQTLTGLVPINQSAQTISSLSGRMQGGNLTMIESSIGTFWQAQTDGAIVFLEEINEKGYRIDRSLQHLKQAGLFDHVHAVVFGEFLGDDQIGINYALQRFANEIGFPVFQTNQFGHGKINYPIVYRAKAKIILDESQLAVLIMSF